MSMEVSMEEIVRIAAEAGVKAYELEKEKDVNNRKDRRLRNTRLLLRKYRVFKLHCSKAVFSSEELAGSAVSILDEIGDYEESTYVESIQKSAVRTKIIIEHIDTMLDLFYLYCKENGRPEMMRRYRVINEMYISGKQSTAKEVAESENIDTRTVYKDIDSSIGILAALFFGIDSMARV